MLRERRIYTVFDKGVFPSLLKAQGMRYFCLTQKNLTQELKDPLKRIIMTKKIDLLKTFVIGLLCPLFAVDPVLAHPGNIEQSFLPGGCGNAAPAIPASSANLSEGLYFIENIGQITDQHGARRDDVDYKLVTGTSVNVFISSEGIQYQWNVRSTEDGQVQSNRLDVSLVGANKKAVQSPENPQAYFEQYYLSGGSQSLRAETYKKIVYKDIYPNIDWVLYLNDDKLEYDFRVNPGGKVADIKLQYDGHQSLKLNEEGVLIAHNAIGQIKENAPISFEACGKPVASHFVLSGNQLSFETGAYNEERVLVIDPVVEWATYYGGIGPGYTREFFGMIMDVAEWDIAQATAFDNELNVYLTGYTNSLTNIATTGAFQQDWGGSADTISAPTDAFLVKFDQTGRRLWATYFGGQGSETGAAIACDEQGNVYIVGGSNSTNVNLSSPNSHQATLKGASDAFIVKFDGAGNRLWATYFGGEGTENATSIVSDKGGHIYVGGNTTSTTELVHLASGAGAVFQNVIGGSQDAFLAKFTEDGEIQWSTYYGGIGNDEGRSLAWDAKNQVVYLAGQTDISPNLGTPNVFQEYVDQMGDAFIAKFSVQGQREWGTYFGGDGLDYGTDVECDDAGNIYLTGTTMTTTLGTPGAFIDTIERIGSYLTKFFPDGQRDWTTYAPGNDLYVAVQGLSIYIGGQTADTFGIATAGAPFEELVGAADVYLMKFDVEGAREWGTYFGSSANDNGGYLDCDGFGNIYLTGRATVPSAITGGIGLATPGAHQDSFATGGNAGSWDAFLVKFSDCVFDLAITIDSLTMGVTGSSTYEDFQWYKDGQVISGANDSTYTAAENGIYSVSVRSALNGCPDSASYEITNIIEEEEEEDNAIAGLDEKKIRVYPNPTHDVLFIQAPTKVNATLKSVSGKVVIQVSDVQSVNLEALAPGLYFLNLTDKEGRLLHTEKLVKTSR